jgi:hypothetical protein
MLGEQPTVGTSLRAGRQPPPTTELPESVRNRISELRQANSDDPGKVANLQRLTSSAGFLRLTEEQQLNVLGRDTPSVRDGYAARPADAAYVREMRTLMQSTDFQGLSETRQSELIQGMATHGNAGAYLGSLDNTQLLSLAESADGPQALTALRATMNTGGLTAAEQTQVERIEAATFTPGAGLTMNGNAADQATTLHAIRREMLVSPSFRQLMNTINADAAHPVTLNAGRNQPRHFVDAFNGGGNQTIDLADIEQWPVTPPAGHPEAMVQGENLVHALAEARHAALGNGYGPSHRVAIEAENRYRRDIGQNAGLRLPPNDTTLGSGNSVIFQFDNGYREQVNVDASGANITGITRHNPPTSP